ncbi:MULTISPECIES: type II toxin-antitoxin system HicA family toxin [Haloferax]|uniref:type II toxin-antitoxin system HicA family toxin n=1 Tax=Haloferax TaxID=2251 RepID=UPI001CDA1074
MVSRDFSGREIVKVLQKFGYRHDRSRGDHAILKYTTPRQERNELLPSRDSSS